MTCNKHTLHTSKHCIISRIQRYVFYFWEVASQVELRLSPFADVMAR